MAEWQLTPQAVAATMTDEQMSELVPAMVHRVRTTSVAAQLAQALGGQAGANGRPGASRAASRHPGRTYGSQDAPLAGADLMRAVGAMQANGDAGRGRPS
jgi:hypothetical protein